MDTSRTAYGIVISGPLRRGAWETCLSDGETVTLRRHHFDAIAALRHVERCRYDGDPIADPAAYQRLRHAAAGQVAAYADACQLAAVADLGGPVAASDPAAPMAAD